MTDFRELTHCSIESRIHSILTHAVLVMNTPTFAPEFNAGFDSKLDAVVARLLDRFSGLVVSSMLAVMVRRNGGRLRPQRRHGQWPR